MLGSRAEETAAPVHYMPYGTCDDVRAHAQLALSVWSRVRVRLPFLLLAPLTSPLCRVHHTQVGYGADEFDDGIGEAHDRGKAHEAPKASE